jgi:hypothetical protein
MSQASGQTMTPDPLYHGCAKIMRRGDHLTPEARVTPDAARALLDSWREAEATGRAPHLYEVAEGRLVIDAVFPTTETTWRAVLLVSEN